MLYKAFAAITLIAAPIIVFVAQSVAPAPQVQPAAAPLPAVAPMTEPAAVAPPPPIAAPAAAAPDAAAFGQPLPDAGKPFLSPGSGLPGLPAPAEGASGDSVEAVSDAVPS
jgi:hypothetical protein